MTFDDGQDGLPTDLIVLGAGVPSLAGRRKLETTNKESTNA